MDTQMFKALTALNRQIAATAILKEAARLAEEGKPILPGNLLKAIETYQQLLLEMAKKGL